MTTFGSVRKGERRLRHAGEKQARDECASQVSRSWVANRLEPRKEGGLEAIDIQDGKYPQCKLSDVVGCMQAFARER